ncbi:MAG: imidazole glycerol phosphate synthase subunit HisH [Natronospirillum sp.]
MSKPVIAVIDYGMGNLHSVAKALEFVAPEQTVIVSSDAQQIAAADRVVLPGVGAMRDCIQAMKDTGVADLVREICHDRPFLGVCVGMQALLEHSSENNGIDALGIFPGRVDRFTSGLKDAQGMPYKVPHMGWNQVKQLLDHPLWQGIEDDARFYFVHSYFAQPEPSEQVAGICTYQQPFAAAIARDTIFATQFHPEKSADAGLQLYRNFAHWDGKR